MRAPLLLILALGLSACADRGAQLPFGAIENNGPDPSAVRPQRELVIPAQLSLPAPVSGTANRADY